MPCALHDGAAWRGIGAQNGGDPKDAFIPDNGDFGRRTILMTYRSEMIDVMGK